jgi:hypothetical protein
MGTYVDARADDVAWVDGTVGSSAAILSVTGTGGTGAAAPAIPGKMVSKLKLIYDDPPGWAERKYVSLSNCVCEAELIEI